MLVGESLTWEEDHTQNIRNIRVGHGWLSKHVSEHGQRQVSEDGVCCSCLIQRVTVYPELDSASASTEETLEDHGQGGLSAVHSGIEEANGRGDLPA